MMKPKPLKLKSNLNSISLKSGSNTRKKIYFIGIGGIGMSAIAQIVQKMGHQVSGSDLSDGESVERLRKMGIRVFIGHQKTNLKLNTDIVVASSAISPGNVEVLYAKENKIPIIHRGDILAEIMRLKKGVAVAGTHGKTTTTSLISDLFLSGNLSPTTMIGGRWSGIDSNASMGESDYMICESDESDGSFLKLYPVYSVVTNIDFDHMDHYKSQNNLIEAFLQFIHHTPFYGKTFLCFEDRIIRSLKEKLSISYASYGFDESFDIYAKKIKFKNFSCKFEVVAYGKNLGLFQLNMVGSHNILNSLAAIGISLEVGINLKSIKKTLNNFKGVVRRMTQIGEWRNLQVIDDYGHHPTEIRVTLATLKEIQKKPVVCIFQPHRYSRTLEHYKEFAEVLMQADIIYLTDIYPAGEIPIKGVNTRLIYDTIKSIDPNKPVFLLPNRVDLERHFLEKSTHSSDLLPKKGILLTTGAGDIYQLAKNLVLEGNFPKK